MAWLHRNVWDFLEWVSQCWIWLKAGLSILQNILTLKKIILNQNKKTSLNFPLKQNSPSPPKILFNKLKCLILITVQFCIFSFFYIVFILHYFIL